MKWFGKNWGAPVTQMCEQAPVPVGEMCARCAEPIAESDLGLILPCLGEFTATELPYHHECFLRDILGSVGHQQGACSCEGGDRGDPPGMTRREAARAAVQYWNGQHGRN